ncbi:MAG: hypothetical protein H6607_09265 [Flavobacteriales bacterium]|nr:hypothetical protein [Flavobacteriales bacterium]
MIIGILSGLILITILGVILMKNKLAKGIMIAFSIILILVTGGLIFLNYFISALAPPKVKITTNYISTNNDFINGVTIEIIKVDSIGSENYPVKYTVTYLTSCHIVHPEGKPPNPPDKIYFSREGKYWWTEENVNIHFIHKGLSRKTTDSKHRPVRSMGGTKLKTCPLKFEKEKWYYITIGDPKVTGIFFYIDKNGKEKQYYLTSGISPI